MRTCEGLPSRHSVCARIATTRGTGVTNAQRTRQALETQKLSQAQGARPLKREGPASNSKARLRYQKRVLHSSRSHCCPHSCPLARLHITTLSRPARQPSAPAVGHAASATEPGTATEPPDADLQNCVRFHLGYSYRLLCRGSAVLCTQCMPREHAVADVRRPKKYSRAVDKAGHVHVRRALAHRAWSLESERRGPRPAPHSLPSLLWVVVEPLSLPNDELLPSNTCKIGPRRRNHKATYRGPVVE